MRYLMDCMVEEYHDRGLCVTARVFTSGGRLGISQVGFLAIPIDNMVDINRSEHSKELLAVVEDYKMRGRS